MDLSGIWGQLLFNPSSSSSVCIRPTTNLIQIVANQPFYTNTNSSDTNSSSDNSLPQDSGNELDQDQDDEANENEQNIEEDSTSEDSKRKSNTHRIRYSKEEYRCSQCPYTCTTEKAFLRHLRKCETKETADDDDNDGKTYPVSCPICGKDRRNEESLSVHMTKHKQQKHFCCDICRFRSLQLKKLIQHRRMHTGEKPHLCPFCSYRSSRRDNLRSHVRRVHKKENLPCDTFTPRSMLLLPRKFD